MTDPGVYASRPPHPPGRDPLLQPNTVMLVLSQDMTTALDFAEFDVAPYPNLDTQDQTVYYLAYMALINHRNLNRHGRPYRHPRSFRDRKSRARLTLRALKQVSDGIRPKFETTGYLIKPGQL